MPEGWGRLSAEAVSVPCRGAFEEWGAARRGPHDAAAAGRTEGGRTEAVTTAQPGLTRAGSAQRAAIAAGAGIRTGAGAEALRDGEPSGTDEAKRIGFRLPATGGAGGPGKGTPAKGVILTGPDCADTPFAARVDAGRGALSGAGPDRPVASIEVRRRGGAG